MSLPTTLLVFSLVSTSVPSPHTPITPGPLAPTASPRLDARRPVRHAERLVLSGSAVLLAGCAAWGTMIGGMWFGAYQRRQYNELVAAINAADRPPDLGEQEALAYRDRQGSRSNTDAIVSAVVGTTLTILGAALLGRGLVLRKRQGRLAAFRLRPGI